MKKREVKEKSPEEKIQRLRKIRKIEKDIDEKSFMVSSSDGKKKVVSSKSLENLAKKKEMKKAVMLEEAYEEENPPLKKSKHVLDIEAVKAEVAKVVVGQEFVVEAILRSILAKGHVLIEGVPGIAKTALIRTISKAAGCEFSRIQFTVDLLPADITGLTTYTPEKGFETIKGPIFAHFIIADEINRAPPKTQSALLQAMQEREVTIGRETFRLEPPFFVMANNNPLESSGTYKLPEAQIDRFLFKIKMGYPKMEHEELIINQNITTKDFEEYNIKKILSPKKIIEMQKLTNKLETSSENLKYIVKIVDATRNPKKYHVRSGKFIEYGASPRASIALDIASKADAVLKGQKVVKIQNIKNIAKDVLRHRILLNYEGQAENVDSDKIIDEILTKVQVSQNGQA